MTRIDVPTLRCDRCEVQTQDLAEMAKYRKIEHHHMSGRKDWDLCPVCWTDLQAFFATKGTE